MTRMHLWLFPRNCILHCFGSCLVFRSFHILLLLPACLLDECTYLWFGQKHREKLLLPTTMEWAEFEMLLGNLREVILGIHEM